MDDPIFEPWSSGAPAPEPWSGRAPTPEPAPTERTPRWRSTARPGPAATRLIAHSENPRSGHVEVLRDLLMPRLKDLCHRLEAARHETTVDDRLNHPTPSLRFRLRPWQAPFDGRRAAAGPVLEILLDGGPAPAVIGRFWVDPDVGAPTHQNRVELSRLTDAWLDRLLLDFVERALQ